MADVYMLTRSVGRYPKGHPKGFGGQFRRSIKRFVHREHQAVRLEKIGFVRASESTASMSYTIYLLVKREMNEIMEALREPVSIPCGIDFYWHDDEGVASNG